ncbi:hypothetical protein [Acidocella sp.]|uniref:hypothetical protein n=1 Tax=Acidocella sp. TaxID=50710 RepID=UPI003D04CF4A
MAEIVADLDRAAANYWLAVARQGGYGKDAALSRAMNLLRDARAESRIPDSARQPTLNELEAPPLDLPLGRRLTR